MQKRYCVKKPVFVNIVPPIMHCLPTDPAFGLSILCSKNKGIHNENVIFLLNLRSLACTATSNHFIVLLEQSYGHWDALQATQ